MQRSTSRHSRQSARGKHSQCSSPERVVNIVCPPSKSTKKKRRQRIGSSSGGSRPRSDMRPHSKINALREPQNTKRGLIASKMNAFAESRGFLYGSFSSAGNRLAGGTSATGSMMAMRNLHRPVHTPLKSQKSMQSYSMSRSKSKSASRLASNKSLRRGGSLRGLSGTKSG